MLPTLEVGGQERLVLSLSRELASLGARPDVIGLVDGGPLEGEFRAAGVPVSVLTPSHLVPGYPAALLNHLRRNPTDVLHCHSGSWFPAAIAGGLRRIPVLHTEHGRYPDEPWWTRPADRLAAMFTNRIVVVSDRLQQEMQERLGLAHPPAIVPNGVAIPPATDDAARVRLRESLGIDQRAPVVGTVGRLVPAKDHALLLRAIALLRSRHPGLRCVIVGEGPLRAGLEEQARAYGLLDQLCFLGHRDDAAELTAAFDVFALSSSTEGTPLAVLEAMATGRPVVATDVGGLAALLQGGVGTLVPHGQDAALAEALNDVLLNPVAARHQGAAGRALIEARFSARSCASAYLTIYRDLARA